MIHIQSVELPVKVAWRLNVDAGPQKLGLNVLRLLIELIRLNGSLSVGFDQFSGCQIDSIQVVVLVVLRELSYSMSHDQ